MAIEVDFWQIVYREEQKNKCFPFAKQYFNEELTPFFENTVIKKLVLGSSADKISVCSWKLKDKLIWNVCRPRELTLGILKSDYQVLSFTCNTRHHQFLNAADKWHPGFKALMAKILKKLSLNVPFEVKNPIYQNHFAADANIYKDYVETFLIPVMDLMETDEEIKTECWKDSGYSQLAKKGGASPEYLLERIGVSYYPMHAFLLERLFAIYCHNKQIKVTYL